MHWIYNYLTKIHANLGYSTVTVVGKMQCNTDHSQMRNRAVYQCTNNMYDNASSFSVMQLQLNSQNVAAAGCCCCGCCVCPNTDVTPPNMLPPVVAAWLVVVPNRLVDAGCAPNVDVPPKPVLPAVTYIVNYIVNLPLDIHLTKCNVDKCKCKMYAANIILAGLQDYTISHPSQCLVCQNYATCSRDIYAY